MIQKDFLHDNRNGFIEIAMSSKGDSFMLRNLIEIFFLNSASIKKARNRIYVNSNHRIISLLEPQKDLINNDVNLHYSFKNKDGRRLR